MFKGFLKLFKKWFFEAIWPEIRIMLELFLLDLARSIFLKLKEIFERYNQQQRDTAKEKAKEAEQKAKEATNPEEKIRYRAREEAFNEMYEELRCSHDKMSKEFEELKTKINKTTKLQVDNLSAENVFENTGNGIDLKFNTTLLLSPNEDK